MLEQHGFTEEMLLSEVRAGHMTPEVQACVSAGQTVNGAPPPALLTLTLTPTLTLTLNPDTNPNPNPNPSPEP